MSREASERDEALSGPFAPAVRSYALRLGDHEIALNRELTVAGRSSDADIQLIGPLVSRIHAYFHLTERGVVLEDAGSRNGVFVNGERVHGRVLLSDGDLIAVGSEALTLLELDPNGDRPAETVSAMRPARPERTLPPESLEGEAHPSTSRRSEAFFLLSSVVDKALALGRSEEAEHLLGSQLLAVLADAKAEQPVLPELARASARYALKLALATGKPAWLDFTLRLYHSLAAPMPLPIVDELYTLLAKVRGLDRALLGDYIDSLRLIAATLSPTERFVLQRLEGLARVVTSQSDRV